MARTQDAATTDTGSVLKRDVGPIGLLLAAIGSIIGSGWLFGAFNASAIAGPSAIFSWLIAAVKPSFANDFGPLAAIATASGLTWIAVLLYIDAVVSPADTGHVYTT